MIQGKRPSDMSTLASLDGYGIDCTAAQEYGKLLPLLSNQPFQCAWRLMSRSCTYHGLGAHPPHSIPTPLHVLRISTFGPRCLSPSHNGNRAAPRATSQRIPLPLPRSRLNRNLFTKLSIFKKLRCQLRCHPLRPKTALPQSLLLQLPLSPLLLPPLLPPLLLPFLLRPSSCPNTRLQCQLAPRRLLGRCLTVCRLDLAERKGEKPSSCVDSGSYHGQASLTTAALIEVESTPIARATARLQPSPCKIQGYSRPTSADLCRAKYSCLSP